MRHPRKHITPIILLLLSVTLQVSAQYAIRPGLELPKVRMAPIRQGNNEESLPEWVDNSLSPYFPSIISQYGGSCAQASGIHYLFTYEMNRTLDRTVQENAAHTFSYRWMWHLLNGGKDEGGFASDGIEITKTTGCMTVSDFGNESTSDFLWPSGYEKYYNAMHYRTREASAIDLTTMEGIKDMMMYMYDKRDGLKGGGIASFSISSDNWGYSEYDGPCSTGYGDIINFNGKGGAHAMTLVGYDLAVEYDCDGDGVISDDERGAFILVNSWGTWWGTEGRAYIPFKYFLDAGNEGSMTHWDANALCIETEYVEPELCLKLTINYSSRNDLNVRFGVADGMQETSPVKGSSITTPILSNKGGDHNMRGTRFVSGNQIEMGFDISSLREYSDAMKAPCFMVIMGKSVLGKPGSGRLLDATVYDYVNDKEYKAVYTDDMNSITLGYHTFKIPTRLWFKRHGQWYEAIETTYNPLTISSDPIHSEVPVGNYAIRRADGSYSKLRITGFGTDGGKIKLEVTQYE